MRTLMVTLALAGLAWASAMWAQGNGVDRLPQPMCGVRADKLNYGLGEPAKMTFVIENRSKQPVTLRFSSSQKYDIWIEKDGKEIWRYSRGMMFAQMLTSLTLKPGERQSFQQTWKQVDNNGEQVPPGAYDVFAQLTTVPPKPTLVKTEVTIGRSKPVVSPATVGAVVNNLDVSLGKLVQIIGTYKGWRPDPQSPACKPGPPVSRSDWALSDGTGCIFVTGRSGLDPTDDYGKRISVAGIVKKTAKGQPYLQAQTVAVMPKASR